MKVIPFLLFLAAQTFPLLIHVGPGRADTSLQQVTGRLNPGDTVQVDGDHTYPGGVTFRRPGEATRPIVVQGLRVNGRRPVISGANANGDAVHFRTDWPYSGPGADHYVFEGFEVTGATNRGIFHQGNDNRYRDLLVHHCMHGFLGADQGSGAAVVEFSEFHNNGSGDRYHQIYMATDEVHYPGSIFRLQFCFIHNSIGGNNVKSRAERNEIWYNWLESAYYHELELIGPDGGDTGNTRLKREDSEVMGNVLWKGNDFSVVRIGGDGTGESHGRYRFFHNTIRSGSGAIFRIFDSLESVEMHNNVFFREGGNPNLTRTAEAAWTLGVVKIAGANNWIQSGSTNMPTQWTGTITGISPPFRGLPLFDLAPSAGGPLVNMASLNPAGVPGYPFPNPATQPQYHPPQRRAGEPGVPAIRLIQNEPDIGAFETTAPPVNSAERLNRNEPGRRLTVPSPYLPGQPIHFLIDNEAGIEIDVLDPSGRLVAAMAKGRLAAGMHRLSWNPGNRAPGLYLLRLKGLEKEIVRKIVLCR